MSRESGKGEMLFSPLEKSLSNVVEKKPTQIDKISLRAKEALGKLLKIREDDGDQGEMIRSAIDKLKTEPEDRKLGGSITTSVELPKGILKDAREDFKKAFPKYAEKFDETQIQYLLGYSELTNEDKTHFLELLGEKGTLMGEAYPFYEILTQKLSEKVASSHKGVWGKVFGAMAKVTGLMTYYQDAPVLREWSNVEGHLKKVYGEKHASELIEDMYFGDKGEYQTFLRSCEAAKLDFPSMVERANKHSRFIDRVKKQVIKNPKIFNNPALVGGLTLPGKIHDMWVMSTVGTALTLGGIGGLLMLAGSEFLSYQMYASIGSMFAGVGVGAGGIGVLFHELTHAYGGNFRRKLKEVNDNKTILN